MWLINTSTFKLVYFTSCKHVPGGYVILSHVWNKPHSYLRYIPEQSFQDLKAIGGPLSPSSQPSSNRDDNPSNGPSSHISSKIKNCCQVARSLGYDWVWIDTCCINKESSAELSEAINSMFTWYANSVLCVAYLEDVPDGDQPRSPNSAFRCSKWFSRGWTLQELLAPPSVVFLSHGWVHLGTKATLAPLIQEITRIDVDVLTFDRPFSAVSVGKRMSWASCRQTTRVEDEAYCLMGLFGVNMPTIYGEGKRAFRRLQEEIMRNTHDQTLFAWGLPGYDGNFETSYPPGLLAPTPKRFRGSHTISSLPLVDLPAAVHHFLHMLSPSRAEHLSRYASGPAAAEVPSSSRPTFPVGTPTFTMTGHGILAHVPLITAQPASTGVPSNARALAVLACMYEDQYCAALILHRVTTTDSLPHYRTDTYPTLGRSRIVPSNSRLLLSGPPEVSLDKRSDIGFASAERLTAAWTDIYISYDAPDGNHRKHCAVPYIPRWALAHVAQHGFALYPPDPHGIVTRPEWMGFWSSLMLLCTEEEDFRSLQVEGEAVTRSACFVHREERFVRSGEHFRVDITVVPLREVVREDDYGCRACVVFAQGADGGEPIDPKALPDVSSWPDRSMLFGDEARNVRLTVSRWPARDAWEEWEKNMIVFDVEVGGTVYSALRAPEAASLTDGSLSSGTAWY